MSKYKNTLVSSRTEVERFFLSKDFLLMTKADSPLLGQSASGLNFYDHIVLIPLMSYKLLNRTARDHRPVPGGHVTIYLDPSSQPLGSIPPPGGPQLISKHSGSEPLHSRWLVQVLKRRAVLEFLNNLWGLGTEQD